jgi:hypothetical protein
MACLFMHFSPNDHLSVFQHISQRKRRLMTRSNEAIYWYTKSTSISDTFPQHIVAYLPHARKAEPQNQLFLSNTRTNNGTAGLRNPFPGYSPVNTLPRRRMTSHSNSTGWESHNLSTARYSWRNNRTEFPVGGRCEVYTLVILQIVQLLTRRVPDEETWMMWVLGAADARE